VTVLDGGAMQLDLKGKEGERVVRPDVCFDFEKDGTLRHRVRDLRWENVEKHGEIVASAATRGDSQTDKMAHSSGMT
jgi:hypothetical protein